jgi:hypothetical protein
MDVLMVRREGRFGGLSPYPTDFASSGDRPERSWAQSYRRIVVMLPLATTDISNDAGGKSKPAI